MQGFVVDDPTGPVDVTVYMNNGDAHTHMGVTMDADDDSFLVVNEGDREGWCYFVHAVARVHLVEHSVVAASE